MSDWMDELDDDEQAEEIVAELEAEPSLRQLVRTLTLQMNALNDKVDRLALTMAQQPWPNSQQPPYYPQPVITQPPWQPSGGTYTWGSSDTQPQQG